MIWKTLPWLAGVTVLAVGVAAALVAREERSVAGATRVSEPFFPELAERPEAIEHLRISTANYDLVLRRSGEAWLAENMGGYPVKGSDVSRVVNSLAFLRTFEPKTDDPALYPAIQVEPPGQEGARSALVSAEGPDGEPLAEAVIGMASSSIGFNPRGGTFLRRPDEARAWLVEGRIDLPGTKAEWFEPIVHIPGNEVRRVAILSGETMLLDAVKQQDEAGTYRLAYLADRFSKPGVVPNQSGIKRIGLGIVSTEFEAARPAAEVDFSGETRSIRFETQDGLVLEVRIAEADGASWVGYEASAKGGSAGAAKAAEIRARTENWAFRLPEHRLAPLLVNVEDLIQPAAP